jgi:hypothetical protein
MKKTNVNENKEPSSMCISKLRKQEQQITLVTHKSSVQMLTPTADGGFLPIKVTLETTKYPFRIVKYHNQKKLQRRSNNKFEEDSNLDIIYQDLRILNGFNS